MHRRYSIALTKRRCLIRFLERRNRVSPRNRVSGDTFNFETNILLAKMRTMTPEEAAAVADQAVAEAEAAMAEAAEAMREAEAAEADALAATTFAAEAFKKRKANTRRMVRYLPFPIYVNVKWLIFPSLTACVVHLPYRSRAQLNLVRQFTSQKIPPSD